MEKNKTNLMAKFLVPSIVGIVLFMIPVKFDGSWTIAVKILADMIGNAIGGILPVLCVGIVTISAIMSALSLAKPKFITEQPILRDTFLVGPIWVVIRVLGAIFIWLTFLGVQSGDENTGFLHMLTSADTGGFVLGDLLTVLVIIFAILSSRKSLLYSQTSSLGIQNVHRIVNMQVEMKKERKSVRGAVACMRQVNR